MKVKVLARTGLIKINISLIKQKKIQLILIVTEFVILRPKLRKSITLLALASIPTIRSIVTIGDNFSSNLCKAILWMRKRFRYLKKISFSQTWK